MQSEPMLYSQRWHTHAPAGAAGSGMIMARAIKPSTSRSCLSEAACLSRTPLTAGRSVSRLPHKRQLPTAVYHLHCLHPLTAAPRRSKPCRDRSRNPRSIGTSCLADRRGRTLRTDGSSGSSSPARQHWAPPHAPPGSSAPATTSGLSETYLGILGAMGGACERTPGADAFSASRAPLPVRDCNASNAVIAGSTWCATASNGAASSRESGTAITVMPAAPEPTHNQSAISLGM